MWWHELSTEQKEQAQEHLVRRAGQHSEVFRVVFRVAFNVGTAMDALEARDVGYIECYWDRHRHGWRPAIHPKCDDRVPFVPVPVPNQTTSYRHW